MGTDSICNWCTANHTKLNVSKTKVTSFIRKTDTIPFKYKLCGSPIARKDTIKILEVFLDSKLYFHQHMDDIS